MRTAVPPTPCLEQHSEHATKRLVPVSGRVKEARSCFKGIHDQRFVLRSQEVKTKKAFRRIDPTCVFWLEAGLNSW